MEDTAAHIVFGPRGLQVSVAHLCWSNSPIKILNIVLL